MMDSVSMSISSESSDSLCNGHPEVQSLLKPILENGIDASPHVSVKYKRRKVSAVRDFPIGCGRFAPKINGKSCENDETVDASECSMQKLKTDCVGPSLGPVKSSGVSSGNCEFSELHDGSKSSDQIELVDSSSKSLVPETTQLPKGIDRNGSAKNFAESSKGLDWTESTDLLKSSSPITELIKDLDKSELLDVPKTLDPRTMELPKDVDQVELHDSSETLKPATVEFSKELDQIDLSKALESKMELLLDLHQMESDNLSKCSEPKSRDQLDPTDSLLLLKDSAQANAHESSIVLDKPQLSISKINAVEERLSKIYPQKRVSANRDFPPGVGRKAPHVSKEELQAIIGFKNKSLGNEKFVGGTELSDINRTVKSEEVEGNLNNHVAKQVSKNVQDGEGPESKQKENVAKEIASKVQVKSVSKTNLKENATKEISVKNETKAAFASKSKGDDTKEINKKATIKSTHETQSSQSNASSQFVGKKVDRQIRSSAGKEFTADDGNDKNLKRKFPREPEGETGNQSQEDKFMGLEPFDDRVTVQALMAAPNCPWRQGKRSSLTPSLARNKVKKEDRSASKKKTNGGSPLSITENSEGKTAKKKSSRMEKVTSQHKNKAIVKYNENSLESLPHDNEDENLCINSLSQDLSVTLIPFGPNTGSRGDDGEEFVTREKVRGTLRLFQILFRKLMQEDESKSKQEGQSVKRFDLLASRVLKNNNKWVNTGKQILGNVPGVEVGDEFHYRVELMMIGLHRHPQGGIDYVKQGGMILATSIVASGGYADSMDNSDVLEYSGQGGNPAGGDKKPEDQKLERGNLALKNSIDAKTPVRVIRGFRELKNSDFQDTRVKSIVTYTYDGLYLVEKYWQEIGPHGCSIFKFKLRRIPGQPELAVRAVKESKKSKVRKGLCIADISEGKEKIPICAVNTINDDRPVPFKYITKMIYPSRFEPTPPKGCDCTDGCSDSEKCACAVRNGGEIPFTNDGAIVCARTLVFECGPSCKCPPSCHNRVSQHGIKFQLEIFKTESRGWGVRSLSSISSGSFICEYTGELLQDTEAEQRTGNDEYLFDIGHNYNDHNLWEGLGNLIPDLQPSASSEVVEDVGFTIDAIEYGNVGRFINHSCSPNLYAQNLLYDHDDKAMPHIMLFAAENIPPLQELTYHYNYTIDQVRDYEGNIRKKECYCGSVECTGRLY